MSDDGAKMQPPRTGGDAIDDLRAGHVDTRRILDHVTALQADLAAARAEVIKAGEELGREIVRTLDAEQERDALRAVVTAADLMRADFLCVNGKFSGNIPPASQVVKDMNEYDTARAALASAGAEGG